tara:strand:- start:517 stop:2385 length:1869 start_codon:yes stop_codon:yes gene_type:complete
MPFVTLKFKPGVDKEGTNYENGVGWFSSDKVRFRGGHPECVGGWAAYSTDTFIGLCRKLLGWTALTGTNYLGIATSKKLYVDDGGTYNDVTPIRASSTINNNPFAITSGSATVTVTDTGHGASIGDYVTYSGCASTGDADLTAAVLNAEYSIDSVTDANTYVFTASASSDDTGASVGGASVVAAYQVSVGLDATVSGTGWGVDSWGSETWGTASSSATEITDQLRLWSLATFGEDLLANIRNGGVYQWDVTNGTATRAVNITSLSGSDTAPTIVRRILMVPESRHLMALACDPTDGIGTQDTMLVRWSTAENLAVWTPDTVNSAGSLRLNVGSEIITGLISKRGVLVWTDSALTAISYVGPPFFFGQKLVSANTSIISPDAAIEIDEITYWMGSQTFYLYDGAVKTMPCTLREHVFKNINTAQKQKVYVDSNRGESEVTWHYPTTTDEVTHYVTYNYQQNIWYGGTEARTAGIDRSFNAYPIRAATDNKLYNHELGLDNGETDPATAISASIESSIFEPFPGDGYQYAFASRLIPDVTFTGSTASSPAVSISITPRDYPGVAAGTSSSTTVTRSGTAPETFTKQTAIRVRGRGLTYKIEKSATGVFFRDGTPRLQVDKDGRQ